MPEKIREMTILMPTTKVKESVKCENSQQASIIFQSILNFEAVELKYDEHFWIMGIDKTGYVIFYYIRYF